MSITKQLFTVGVFSLLLIGISFRFYNFTWGAPFYFHPDERNIATITSLPFNQTLFFKGTFAYGNFLIILGSFIKTITQPLFSLFKITNPLIQALLILRFFSAASSVILLLFLYKTGKLWSTEVGIMSVLLGVFSVGFIQQAHFGTFDIFVSTFALASCYFILLYKKTNQTSWYYWSVISIALASSAKITSLVLLIFPFITILFLHKRIFKKILYIVLGGLFTITTTLLLSPYYLTSDFLSGITYEQTVVSGIGNIFYTQSFLHTPSILFQLLNIYPFLTNPFVELFFFVSFFGGLIFSFYRKDVLHLYLFGFFLVLFLPQSLLFAKWTRYMLPTLPFIYLLITTFFYALKKKYLSKKKILVNYILYFSLISSSIFYSFCYFQIVLTPPDTRLQAAAWAKKYIQPTVHILTEPYDLGLLPFQSIFPNIVVFPFYDLDQKPQLAAQLAQILTTTDIILLPSQRLYRSRLLNPIAFPKGHVFYQALITGRLGFRKAYQTPCDLLCDIETLNSSIFLYEETATVFDHPTVFIFNKTKYLTLADYLKIFPK